MGERGVLNNGNGQRNEGVQVEIGCFPNYVLEFLYLYQDVGATLFRTECFVVLSVKNLIAGVGRRLCH